MKAKQPTAPQAEKVPVSEGVQYMCAHFMAKQQQDGQELATIAGKTDGKDPKIWALEINAGRAHWVKVPAAE